VWNDRPITLFSSGQRGSIRWCPSPKPEVPSDNGSRFMAGRSWRCSESPEAERVLARLLTWYDEERLQSALGNLPPTVEGELGLQQGSLS
jgi:hypothetical protein